MIVVAHPDDETIWMGGTILRNKTWDWTIFSLCRRSDPDRVVKFRNVCKFYNASSIIDDLEDEELKSMPEKKIVSIIENNLNERNFDYIYTHGENGEYGHIRHKEVHNAVKSMVDKKLLRAGKIFYFSYVGGKSRVSNNPELIVPVPKSNSDFEINLDKSEFKTKKKIITKLYGFDKNSFEELSCNRNESFDIKNEVVVK